MKYREKPSYNPHARQSVPTIGEGDIRSNLDRYDDGDVRKKKIRRFIEIVESVIVSGWRLGKITANTQNGVSVYGFFTRESTGATVQVRLSDHAAKAHSSHSALHLRDPKNGAGIVKYLQTLSSQG